MYKKTACIVAGVLAGFSSQPWADEDAHRERDAHVHGVASMNLAIEANELVVELVTPAVNIVGFEHPPRDEVERDSVKNAVASLRQGGSWLNLPAEAACSLESAEVATGLPGHEGEMEHEAGGEHAAHEEHDDDDGHEAHETHEEHAEDEDHDDHAAHSEFHVHYAFHCDNPGEIQAVRVKFFEGFAGMEEIEIQALTETRQVGGTLTAEEPVIQLTE